MSSGSYLWGIDLGGTKIEGVVLRSADNPEVLVRERLPTESQHGYRHVINQIVALVERLSAKIGSRPDKLGIGTPGILDPHTQLMKNCNTTCLNGMTLRKDLEQTLGMNVVMANDANCFALAETRHGIVKQEFPEAKVIFGVILGTGVGGGLVIDNKINIGRHGIGGEWGHNFLDESGGLCYCGRRGCVETVLSGPALEKYYVSLGGEKLTLPQIYELHIKGDDKNATLTIDRLTNFFGKALAVVINIVDPDVIVLGGGVGNIDALYTAGVESLKKYVFNDHIQTSIVKPKLGDSAGVFGAAYLS
ncbi:MAG: ROK family protein [Cyclobacteriaceae bacterium]